MAFSIQPAQLHNLSDTTLLLYTVGKEYRIEAINVEVLHFSEEEVESIRVVEEYLCGGVGSLRSRTVPVSLGGLRLAASDYRSQ
ncbi:hypothetical protein [Salinibacter ruber]|uniref:hypothetical protein n=1 Tax=Salinibacter ruber TaxID=146919 RepID=UPI0020732BFD|nr:hypothetical protein [Salinibacter ruber]